MSALFHPYLCGRKAAEWLINMGIGFRIKTALRERKMTIKALSTQSGVSLNTLYSITKRDSENVDEVILSKIAKTLGLSWAFFCACPPFEDLDFLQLNKEPILLELEKLGLFSRAERSFSDVGTYEFWKIVSDNVFDVAKDENGHVQVFCEAKMNYDPISEMGADVDSLLEFFTKLEPFGRQLVIEYARLLTSNPGFLLKESN